MCQAIKKWVPGGGYNLSSVAGAPRGMEQKVGGHFALSEEKDEKCPK